jgi:hypothetical protein
MLVGPTVEGIHYALKTLLDCFLPERTVIKRDLKDTADVIPKALIFPEFC